MINIGIVLISNEWAGAERAVYNISKSLSKMQGVKVTLFVNEEMFHFDGFEAIGDAEMVSIGKYLNNNKIAHLFSFINLKRNLKKEIKKRNIDILNSHMEMAYLISPKKNLIIVNHGDDIKNFMNPPSLFSKLFIERISRSRFNDCQKIISVCNWQKQQLPGIYKEKTVVIPNGIDTKVFKKLKNVKGKKAILFTGRYIERKGFLEVLKVAKRLPQYDFWFAGYGSEDYKINLPNTTNLGFKSTEELVELYNKATICVFPAYWEALPLCGLEAMACGKAVIATPLGFSEYIQNERDGIIIPTKNTAALKTAILRLMSDTNLRLKLEKNASKKVIEYSWDNVARQYLKIFKQL